ncbi:MAG: DUF1446 domain-containing protein [Pirellulales bacterium]|nr:DUF1446 domain-containing protein [Pirellulales bacterium]
MPADPEVLRVANCSGFWGDRLSAAREMLEGGPIDVLTGDYLAELTMLILWKGRQKDAAKGYATTFLKQMEQSLGLALERGVKIVANAGGLNPRGLADELRKLCDKLGLKARIAHIEGDDLLGRLDELQAAGHELKHLDSGKPLAALGRAPLTANAYLGGWGIAESLGHGADMVICPRVTDAALVVGPAAWHFKWQRHDWDRLAGAVVVGHVLECGCQCTGGNYAFFQEVPGLERPGFPLAEMHRDGSAVLTKHRGTGGLVSVGTVTAQLLYEIDAPRYFNPDVVARFDTINLRQVGPDRVEISGVKGEPAPSTLKVCLNYLGGFRNTMTFVLTGLDIDEKASLAQRSLHQALNGGRDFDQLHLELIHSEKLDAATNTEASALLRVTAKSLDPDKVGRRFSNVIVEMALASFPGFYCTTPPQEATPFGVYWPALIDAAVVPHTVVFDDGRRIEVPHSVPRGDGSADFASQRDCGSTGSAHDAGARTGMLNGPKMRLPLGTLFGARSGDKGGNANVGIWGRSDAAYQWLANFLTVERFVELFPEAAPLRVARFEFPNLRALNFVVFGLLGEGVASSVRFDAQAKSLGEFLRSREVELPEALLSDAPLGAGVAAAAG